MATYETSGAWKEGAVTHYCSPGLWTASLDEDTYSETSLYTEYRAVCGVFDIDANTMSEVDLGHNIQNGSLDGTADFNGVTSYNTETSEFTKYPILIAGYSSGQYYVAYTLEAIVDEEAELSTRVHSLTGTTRNNTLESEDIVNPTDMIVWTGSVVLKDDGKVKRIS